MSLGEYAPLSERKRPCFPRPALFALFGALLWAVVGLTATLATLSAAEVEVTAVEAIVPPGRCDHAQVALNVSYRLRRNMLAEKFRQGFFLPDPIAGAVLRVANASLDDAHGGALLRLAPRWATRGRRPSCCSPSGETACLRPADHRARGARGRDQTRAHPRLALDRPARGRCARLVSRDVHRHARRRRLRAGRLLRPYEPSRGRRARSSTPPSSRPLELRLPLGAADAAAAKAIRDDVTAGVIGYLQLEVQLDDLYE